MGKKKTISDFPAANNFYTGFFNKSPDAIFIASLDGSVYYANPAACSLLGRTSEEICRIGRNEIVVGKLPQLVIDSEVNPSNAYGELFLLRKDGTQFPVEATASFYCDNEGHERFLIVARDITNRKKTEKELLESEERYRNLVELSPVGIAIYQDGKFVYVNECGLRILGCKDKSEFINTEVLDIVHSDIRVKVLERMSLVSAGMMVPAMEETLIRKNGETFDAEVTALPTTFNGRPAGQVLVVDITERKKMEDVIKQTNNYNRSLLEASLDPLVTISPEGIVMDVNKAAEKMIGMKRDKLIGNPYIDYVREKNKAHEGFKIAFTKGVVKDLPLSVIHKSGKSTDVLINATVFRNEQGQVQGILVAGRDITQRKKMEAKLRYSKKMLEQLGRHVNEIRESERSQLALNLHDDLGQRLTGLFLDVAWIKSRIGVQSATVRSRLEEMSQTINETIDSIREISYFLRPTILYDLGVVPAIFSQLNKFEKHTGIKCNFYFDSEEFNIDDRISLALFRIIQESLTNIMRHSMASAMTVSLKKLKKNIEMVIEDNGIGIDEDKVSSLNSMGLEGIRERAKSANGEVSITGEKGEGTIIVVTIPYKRKSI